MSSDLIAVFPEPPPPDLARTLDLAGYRWKAFSSADIQKYISNNYIIIYIV